MIKGDQAKRLTLSMADIMVELDCGDLDKECWNSFGSCMTKLETWTKVDATSEVSDEVLEAFEKESNNLFRLLKSNPTFDEHLTPYLHILCSHMLVQLKGHKNLQKFSQQGPEHWMGLLQAMYMKHTNRRDTRSVSEGLNPKGMEAIRRLFVMARVRLLLTTPTPRTLPTRSPRSDIGKPRSQ